MNASGICVLGGGPAGSFAALALAKGGRSCRLLERSTAAADKVCGEFLSPEAVGRLQALAFPWHEAQAMMVRRVHVEAVERSVTMSLPFEARSVARAFLDAWLLGACRAVGVEVLQGVYVREVQRDEGGFQLRTAEGVHTASTLVLATGKHTLGRFHERTPAPGPAVVGWKMNFNKLGRELRTALHETLGLFFFPGGYGGISFVDPETVTVSVLVQPGVLQASADFLPTLAPRLPLLAQVLAQSEPLWERPRTVANLPYGHCEKGAEPGLFMVGDQFAVLPSFTGTGLSFAMASGVLAAQHIVSSPVAQASVLYAAQARVMARQVQRRALPLHRWLQSPLFCQLAMRALGLVPSLLPAIAKATRVPDVAWAKECA